MAKIRLWFVRETQAARFYSKLPPDRRPTDDDHVWIPKSQIEHTSLEPSGLHIVTVTDWFAEKKGL